MKNAISMKLQGNENLLWPGKFLLCNKERETKQCSKKTHLRDKGSCSFSMMREKSMNSTKSCGDVEKKTHLKDTHL